ncbi:DUF2130 domain-containing protein [Sulfurimonas sp. SAG-AH-194-I05]|nr:DUF2130 domain-containing protein [Sulfurimonas sp. SAG-AH-194-I05]MDF1875636.1 DUF2130 domain-containing protein [Sulfurimonas sp. SAG-AH-194-I05]
MKQEITIECPKCSAKIDINEALYGQLENQFSQDTQKKREEYKLAMQILQAKEQNIKTKEASFEQKLQEQLHLQLQSQKAILHQEMQKELDKQQATLKIQYKQMQEHAMKKANQATAEQVASLESELSVKSKQVQELNASKATIAKLQRENEEIESKIQAQSEIALTEQLIQERAKLQKTIEESHQLKFKQKEEQLRQLTEQLQIAQRKAEQGSMQLQGEVQELAIEEYLRLKFPLDTIEEIKKGENGADCLQTINTPELANCATIYYESKRAKNFSNIWIEKFKADMREKGVDLGVLVSTVLPKELESMGLYQGIWICTFEEFKLTASIMRDSMIKISYAKRAGENKEDKMARLYTYLTSTEFGMQIEAIVEGFESMHNDLQKEKRAMAKIWKQREKQLDKVLDNTIAMYGSIKGIAGNAIASIDILELEHITDNESKEEEECLNI